MVVWSEFRLSKYRDDDHREDESHFSLLNLPERLDCDIPDRK